MLVVRSEYSLSEFEPWGGAVETLRIIEENNKLQELEFILEDQYPNGVTDVDLNETLWYDSDWILESLGLDEYTY